MVTSFAWEMGLRSHIADQLHATLLDTLHLADNRYRPHNSLDYLTPVEYAQQQTSVISLTPTGT